MPTKKPVTRNASSGARTSDKLLANILVHFLDEGYTQRGKVAVLSRCGLSYDDIAAVLETSVATVKQSVYEVKSGKGGLRRNGDEQARKPRQRKAVAKR